MITENYDWQYNEMQQIGTDYNDIKEIEKYDERMSRFRDVDSEINEIFDFLNIQESDKIVEFGSGTGRFVLAASKKCCHVTAVDISKLMLEYVQNKAAAEGVKNIDFVNAGFLSYNSDDNKVDSVVSQLALHHLPDFWKLVALKKIYDMLETGGKFYLRDAVFSIPPDKYSQKIEGFLKYTSESAGEENAKNYARHIKQEFSTFDWIMEEMLYRAGFYIEKAEYNDSMIATYCCIKPKEFKV